MKKFISICLVISFVFLLCSCGSVGKKTSQAVIALTVDKSKVSPGEEITLTLNISGVEKFTSMDIAISAPEEAEFKDASSISVSDLISESNNHDGTFVISAYVATTANIENDDIYKIEYQISPNASKGKAIKFTPNLISFMVGIDENGDETVSAIDSVELKDVSVVVE